MEPEAIRFAVDYLRGMPWVEVKAWLDLGLWYGLMFAALLCLLRLRTIQRVITEFNRGRGPLWDMRTTVQELKDLEPRLRDTIGQVSALTAQTLDLTERVEGLKVQLAALQVETISQRTSDVEPVPSDPAPPVKASSPIAERDDDVEERNWEALREYWRRNTRRLEFVIDQIPDGRVRGAFDRLPRTNYVRIIHKLQGQDRISPGVAEASKKLIDEFNRYRPRSRTIPDEVVDGVRVLDAMLEKELVPISTVEAREEARDAQLEVALPPAIPMAAIPPNGGRSVPGGVHTRH